MSDHNTSAIKTTGDVNIDTNPRSGGGYDYANGSVGRNNKTKNNLLVRDSFNIKIGTGDQNSTHGMTVDQVKPSSEVDPRHEEESMVMMDEYSDADDKQLNNYTNTSYDFDVSYSGDIAMMDSYSNSNNAHHHHGTKQNGVGGAAASHNGKDTSDLLYSGKSHGTFQSRDNGNSRVNASSFGEEVAPSWLGAVKDAATKVSTPETIILDNDLSGGREEGAEQEMKQSDQDQEYQGVSPEATAMMQEISSKLDDKLNNTRLLAKKLLQEMTIYVQSLESVANEYERIREAEFHESQRLDAVEPEVNGASGMLLGGTNKQVGNFFAVDDTVAENSPAAAVGHGHHYQHMSSSKPGQFRPVQMSDSINDRNGVTEKGNRYSVRHSYP